ncbi:MAG: hypothetical protein VX583_03575 [Bdellovibrionota bacterium]
MFTSTRIIGMFSKKWESENLSLEAYLTADRKIGFGLKVSTIDAEKADCFSGRGISNLIISDSDKILVRIISNFGVSRDFKLNGTARDEALEELGRCCFTNYLFFEKQLKATSVLRNLFSSNDKIFEEEVAKFLNEINLSWLKEKEVEIEPCSIEEYRFFSLDVLDSVEVNRTSFRFNSLFGSTVRLWEPLGQHISPNTLPLLRQSLGPDHFVSTTFKKKNKAKMLLSLKKRQKQSELATNRVDAIRNEGIQAAQEDMEIHNAEIFEIDMNVIFYGSKKEEVEKRAYEGRGKLKVLGHFGVEHNTSFKAFTGTRIGAPVNYSFVEEEKDLDTYIPIYGFSPSKLYSQTKRSLPFHRLSNDVEYFDLYKEHDANSNFSAVVIGKMGRGKSVLLNSLIDCMLMDEDLKIMLVDVKGSFKRTVSRYSNKVYSLELGKATGLNPFRVIKESMDTNKKVELLKEFIKVLVKKPDEKYLDSEIVSIIEQNLKNYIESNPAKPGLTDFVKFSKDLPRIETLRRWCTGGALEMIFSGNVMGSKDPQITYFNFEDISTASDSEVSGAVISAILCEYYAKLNSKPTAEKLVFIVDETPFFVTESFDFFKLINKNIRKLNGSMILAAQSSSDLIVNNDQSLIDNVSTYFLFSVDGAKEYYKEVFKLSDFDYERILACQGETGDFSTFMLKDGLGFRKCYLRLTKSEYWKATSRAIDIEKLESLKKAVPLLSDNECYEILKRGGM